MSDEWKKGYVKDVGPGMLDGLTSKLYSKPSFVIREYISNAIDAESEIIRITCIPPEYNNLTIIDNGKGFRKEDLREILGFLMPHYGDEEKRKRYPPIGKFGIGLYAGGKICDTIEVRTTVANSKEMLYVKIPFAKWKKEKDKRGKFRKRSLFDITEFERRVEIKDEYESKQGTVIVLRKLHSEFRKQMKFPEFYENLVNEVRRQIPVPFDPDMILYKSQFEDLLGALEKLKMTNIANDFLNKMKELDEIMADAGIEFNLFYNCKTVRFNGKQLHRPYPQEKEKEPVGRVISNKKFIVKNKMDEDTLVGVGWAMIRGPRIKKSKKVKDPVELIGVFQTREIQGVQVRLNNVEIIPYNHVWNEFDVKDGKLSSQPIDKIWGEINLFHEEIDLSHDRREFIEEGMYIQIKKQIKEWLEELLSITESRRKQEGSWRRVLRKYNEFAKKFNEIIDELTIIKFDSKLTLKKYESIKDSITKSIKQLAKSRTSYMGSKEYKNDKNIIKLAHFRKKIKERKKILQEKESLLKIAYDTFKENGDKYFPKPSSSPVTTTPSSSPVTTTPSSSPVTTKPSSSPVTTKPSSSPVTTEPSSSPVTTKPSSSPVTTTPSSSPVTTTPSSSESLIDDEDKNEQWWIEWKDRVLRVFSLKNETISVLKFLFDIIEEIRYSFEKRKDLAEKIEDSLRIKAGEDLD